MMTRFLRRKRLTRAQFEAAVRSIHDLAKLRIKKFTLSEQETLENWLRTYTSLINLCTLTRVDSREKLLNSMQADCVRVFLLELSISFYAHAGDTDDFEERLVNSIADGLRIEGRNPEHCELPQEVLVSAPMTNFPATLWHPMLLALKRSFRLTSETTLGEYLISNRHMQMVVLLAFSDDIG